ncbi:MAG TPA: ABC transporter permease, partial [Clostridiales bacterium]|nr:ABC transporter permease [Clostridiales bacterium]
MSTAIAAKARKRVPLDPYRKKSLWENMKEYRASYTMLFPFLLIFFVFTVIPVVISIVLGFTYYNVLEFPKWIGWENYTRLFVDDDIFLLAVRNTFVFAAITGPVSYIMCLFFAWIINELPGKLRAFMTLVFYAPSIAGATAIWLLIFSSDMYGYANSFLLKLGFISEPINWLKDAKYMMTICIIVQLWSSLGASFLSLRAGFNTIDRQYYEASAVDGLRNRWQELWYITLPLMSPHLMLSAILAITGAFGAGALITALCGFPSTGYAVHTIMHHLGDYSGIRMERGYAAAISTLLFIIML